MVCNIGTGCQNRSFLSSYLSEPEPDVKRSITLSDLLRVLDRDSGLIVTRRIGPNTKEALFCGTVRQLLDMMKAERFRDFPLEQIDPDVWGERKLSFLIATVGIHKERPPPMPPTSRTGGRKAKKKTHPYSRAVEKKCQEDTEQIRSLEKKLAAAAPAVTEFKVRWTAWQEEYRNMMEILDRITQANEEQAVKLRRAVKEALEQMVNF